MVLLVIMLLELQRIDLSRDGESEVLHALGDFHTFVSYAACRPPDLGAHSCMTSASPAFSAGSLTQFVGDSAAVFHAG